MRAEYKASLSRAEIDFEGKRLVITRGDGTQDVREFEEDADYITVIAPLMAEIIAQQKGRRIVRLTSREEQVFGLVLAGYRNQAIAQRILRSVKTIEAHKAAIANKLGLPRVKPKES